MLYGYKSKVYKNRIQGFANALEYINYVINNQCYRESIYNLIRNGLFTKVIIKINKFKISAMNIVIIICKREQKAARNHLPIDNIDSCLKNTGDKNRAQITKITEFIFPRNNQKCKMMNIYSH